ncbi:hypothetical protein GF312_17795 [Candidatus Poribacteria bacterium]|nr:hypothetical protein [Candidatus Poribacteria bacterium]
MTGKEKIEAAFSRSGTPEIPAVICYEGIFVRDHWEQITSYPWWYRFSPDIEHQVQWRKDMIKKVDMDWFVLPYFYSRTQRKYLRIETDNEDVYMVNDRSNLSQKITKPQVSGWSGGNLHSVNPDHQVTSQDEIDILVSINPDYDAEEALSDGKDYLARILLQEFDLFPICHVGSPLWNTYSIWGFEGMMTMIAQKPELVEYACQRLMIKSIQNVQGAAALGAKGIWIEECFTDMISPEAFDRLCVPFIQGIVEECCSLGLKSIYYFCGNPAGKWSGLLSAGADALSLEESKKGFIIDIEDVVKRTQGKCAVLGNLDAIKLLLFADKEKLGREISRQIKAGRQNNNRFIMSLGSPVTPGTSINRVRLYCELTHQLGLIS